VEFERAQKTQQRVLGGAVKVVWRKRPAAVNVAYDWVVGTRLATGQCSAVMVRECESACTRVRML
jgi:hypothetical protein